MGIFQPMCVPDTHCFVNMTQILIEIYLWDTLEISLHSSFSSIGFTLVLHTLAK